VTVVGNETFEVSFSTGLEAFTFFRLYNAPNSTAVIATVIVSGYLIGNDHKGSK
jgi:hypothetical protein